MDPITIMRNIRTSQDTVIVTFDNETLSRNVYNKLKDTFSYKKATIALNTNRIKISQIHSCLFLLHILNFLKKSGGTLDLIQL